MKNIFHLILSTMLCPIMAQVHHLPYVNGFNTSAQRAEFVSVRTGNTGNYNWSYYTNNNPFEFHDYPVGGSSSDTVSDWLFSPLIKVEQGAVLSFRYIVYGISGNATPVDEFSIWYGKSDKNPFNGTFVKLADLTNKISSSNVWLDTSDIALPFPSDSGYVAFRHKATNNWFTISLDSVRLKIPGLSISSQTFVKLTVFPNPAHDIVHFVCNSPISKIELYTMDQHYIRSANEMEMGNGSIATSELEAGFYLLKFVTDYGTFYRKFCID